MIYVISISIDAHQRINPTSVRNSRLPSLFIIL